MPSSGNLSDFNSHDCPEPPSSKFVNTSLCVHPRCPSHLVSPSHLCNNPSLLSVPPLCQYRSTGVLFIRPV